MKALGPGALDERAHARRRSNPDRVREHDLGATGEARCELGDPTGIDRALERTAEAHGDRDRRGNVGESEDRVNARERLFERRVPVCTVEAFRRRERDVDAVEPGGAEALEAALVQHEPGVLRTCAPLDRRHDLLRSGHLRHAVVANEAHRLDARQPSRREPVDQLGPHRGTELIGLVLKAVSRPDVAERDVRHACSVATASPGG